MGPILAKWANHNQQLKVFKCAWNALGSSGLVFGKALARHGCMEELDLSRTGATILFFVCLLTMASV